MNTMNNCSCNQQGRNAYGSQRNAGWRQARPFGQSMMPDREMAATMENCRNDPSTSGANDPLYGMPVGMGYVPWQQWNRIYDPPEGLANGTIFPELDLPFCGCIPKDMVNGRGGRI